MVIHYVPGGPPTVNPFADLRPFGSIKKRILLVQGENEHSALAGRLSERGFIVTRAKTYVELQKMDVKRGEFDAVILDVSLPMDADDRPANDRVSEAAVMANEQILPGLELPCISVSGGMIGNEEVKKLSAVAHVNHVHQNLEVLVGHLRKLTGGKQTV